VLVLLLWHFLVASGYREPGDRIESAYLWGTWASKFARLGSEFFHFTPRVDLLLVFLLAASLLTWVGVPRLRDLRQPRVLELWALSATFLSLFFVLPLGYSEAFYVDTRPLPLASFFFICACLSLPHRDPARGARREPVALLLAALLAIANIAYLTHHFVAEREWVSRYRSIVARLPFHARVLPVYTHGGEGAVVPFLHTSGFLSIDRAAIEPYVFAAENGNPMKYFRYTHLPYDPPEVWYGEIPRPRLDWRAVARDYDFLLVTKPYEPSVLGLPTRTVADNSTATLLAIVK
jgi:cytochrome b561